MRHAFRLALGREASAKEIDLAKRKLGPPGQARWKPGATGILSRAV